MHKVEPKQCIFRWTRRRSQGLTGSDCTGILRTQNLCEIDAPNTPAANSWPTPNPWLAAVEPSPIGETKRWVLGRSFPADRPLIDLSQAVPGYPPALELRRHLGEILLDPAMHGYTPILGLPALRDDYAAHLSSFYGASIAPDEVGITSGCNQAFCLALMSIAKAWRPSDPAAPALLQSRHVAAHAGRRAGSRSTSVPARCGAQCPRCRKTGSGRGRGRSS